jgi:hypothetical protein
MEERSHAHRKRPAMITAILVADGKTGVTGVSVMNSGIYAICGSIPVGY